MEIIMKTEKRRRQMKEDIPNLKEQKKNIEELRKYLGVEELKIKKLRWTILNRNKLSIKRKEELLNWRKKIELKKI